MSERDKIYLVECPRDAIQSLSPIIPTQKKIKYYNSLIASGLFDCIDFGSFVSPASVPQMKDTGEVLLQLKKENDTQLLAIIANRTGAQQASTYQNLDFLGYPFSVSESFQQRNANVSIKRAFEDVLYIQELAQKQEKKLLIYVSMAFGNPYGDPWDEDIVLEWINTLKEEGISHFSLSDTTSSASPEDITSLFQQVFYAFPELIISAHFHSNPGNRLRKIRAAYDQGCRRFEGAILGYGGCPFAQDDLVGNIPMELLLSEFTDTDEQLIFDLQEEFMQMINGEGNDL